MSARPIRVLAVDDSAVIRGLYGRWVAEADGCEMVGSARNGEEAIERVRALGPDVVLLDLDMPEMGGLAALPELLAARPGLSVIVISTLTERNAAISLQCLAEGAADYLPKPRSGRELTGADAFRNELLGRIRSLGARRSAAAPPPAPSPPPRPRPAVAVRFVVIGASTGGPRAVPLLLRGLRTVAAHVPIVVLQHLPAPFTAPFAVQLGTAIGLPCREARAGEVLRPGTVLVAPGGRHLRLHARTNGEVYTLLDDGPPVNHCRPSLDPLLEDAAAAFGPAVVAAVLTGMGQDGLAGARAVRAAGGTVLVQDLATSVVWGMPGAIARAGLADAILPLDAIAGAVEAALSRPAGLAPTARSGPST